MVTLIRTNTDPGAKLSGQEDIQMEKTQLLCEMLEIKLWHKSPGQSHKARYDLCLHRTGISCYVPTTHSAPTRWPFLLPSCPSFFLGPQGLWLCSSICLEYSSCSYYQLMPVHPLDPSSWWLLWGSLRWPHSPHNSLTVTAYMSFIADVCVFIW